MDKFELITNKYGQQIWIQTNGHINDAIRKKGIYDEQSIFFIEKILKSLKNPICLDIGANVGNHALVMSLFSKRIYCFDPEPENVEQLSKSIKVNQLHNIEIFPVGLSDKNESLTLYKNGIGGRTTFSPELSGVNFQTYLLICKMGDDIVNEKRIENIDFIKIDIEGFEARALYGLKNSILKFRPIIIMEWNNEITKSEFKKYQLFETIFKNYRIFAILNTHHKNYWGNSLQGKITRFFYRKFFKKSHRVCTFNPTFNYANILLFPEEKTETIFTSLEFHRLSHQKEVYITHAPSHN